MPYDLVKAFPFLFYIQITFGTKTRKERSLQTRKGRKRERKNDSQTQRPNPKRSGEIAPSSSQFTASISLFLNLPLPFEPGLIVAAPCRSRSCLCADRTSSTASHDLAFTSTARSRLSSNPVASLSSFFSQFDRIWWYFFLGFVCVSVLRNEWYYIFVLQLRKCE